MVPTFSLFRSEIPREIAWPARQMSELYRLLAIAIPDLCFPSVVADCVPFE